MLDHDGILGMEILVIISTQSGVKRLDSTFQNRLNVRYAQPKDFGQELAKRLVSRGTAIVLVDTSQDANELLEYVDGLASVVTSVGDGSPVVTGGGIFQASCVPATVIRTMENEMLDGNYPLTQVRNLATDGTQSPLLYDQSIG